MDLLLNGEDIYRVIPNRFPLMILDSLEIHGDEAVSRIVLKGDEWFFSCHYPGSPILPLSLLIESMTQTFCAIFLSRSKEKMIPVLYGLSEIKSRESIVPGDTIEMRAKMESFRRGIACGTCEAYKKTDSEDIMITGFNITEVFPEMMVKRK